MAHPYSDKKSLHTDRLGKMLGGMAREKGAKAAHEQLGAAKGAKSGMSMHGGKAKYARGGRTKGKTNININVMPAAPEAGPALPPTLPAGMGALPAPPPKPPMGPPMGAGPGMPPGLPPGMPPGAPMMPHKYGGAAYKKGGAVKRADGGDVKPRNLRYGWQRSTDKDTGTVTEKPNWGRADERKAGGSVKRADGGSIPQDQLTDAQRKKANDYNNAMGQRKSGGRLFSENAKMKDIKHAAGGGKGRLEKAKLYGGK